MSKQKIYIKEDSKEKAIRKIEQTISETAKKVLNETKWIGPNDEPIDGPDYDSIDNQSQNNLPPIDRYHPDYWYYRQEEEPYDPTYDEGYLDDYSVNNDNEFKDDLDDWGIEENKQYNKNRNMKQTIKLRESELKRIIAESVKRVLNEYGDTPEGNFGINAVYGRRAAERYYTNMNNKKRAENSRVMNMAGDKLYRNYRENPDLGFDNPAGYYYGFQKGVEKYKNESLNNRIDRIIREQLDTISDIKDIHRSSKFPSKYKRWGDEDDEDDELEGLTY